MAGLVVAVLALVLAAAPVRATTYTVGDSQGWNLTVNYDNWVSGKTFAVGDSLLFQYDKTHHNVMEVKQSDYNSCSTSNTISTYSNGNTTIALNTAGARYFICGFPTHCANGMKLTVTVSGSGSGSGSRPTPVPGGSTAPAPNVGGSATPPTSPSGGQTPPSPSAGALSISSHSKGALFSGVLLACIALLG